jgi:hypothetical protein
LPRRIHIVRTIDNGLGFDGRKSFTDEFNRKTTDFKQNLPNFVRIAVMGLGGGQDPSISSCNVREVNCGVVVPNRSVILTDSGYGEDTCASDDMVLVDLNVLVRATATGAPKLLDPRSLQPCYSERFSASVMDEMSTKYGIGRAFDKSAAPDNFWETSITRPVTLDISYRVPTALTAYEFAAGETGTRMPVIWKLFASADGQMWTAVDEENITGAWNSGETRRFTIKAKPVPYYRFIFEKSSHPSIMRIYEINLLDETK